MRCDSEASAEAANEMRGAGSDELAGRSERHRLERMRFEEVTQPFGELAGAAGIFLLGVTLEMRPDALGDEGKVGLRLERLVGVTKSLGAEHRGDGASRTSSIEGSSTAGPIRFSSSRLVSR